MKVFFIIKEGWMFMSRLGMYFWTILVLLLLTSLVFPPQHYADETNQMLIDALEDLKSAMVDKIDYDAERTATAFADAKNIWISKRWADIFKAPLAVIEGAITIIGSMLDWEDISENAQNVLDSSEANLEIASLMMTLEEMQQVGEDLQLAIDGPTYTSSVERMLDAADVFSTIFSLDYEGYKGTIRSHLYMDYGPVIIPHKSADIRRRNSGIAQGALEMRRDVINKFDDLITELSSATLPPNIPLDKVVGQIRELERSVKQSRLSNVDIQYETYLRDEANYVLATINQSLGSIGDLEKIRIFALGNFDKKMQMEQVNTVHSAVSSVMDATLLYVGTKYKSTVTGEVLGEVKKLGVVSSAVNLAASKLFYTDAEDQVYMIPQEMAMSLPGEFSNLWMVADDAVNYIRYLINSFPSKSTKFNSGDYVRTSANLNMRVGPGTGHGIITTLPSGNLGQVVVDGNNGVYADKYHWWHVQFGSYNGWCAENWLHKLIRPISPIDRTLVKSTLADPIYWFQNNRLYYIVSPAVIEKMSSISQWTRVIEYTDNPPEFIFTNDILNRYTKGPDFITNGSSSDGLLISLPGSETPETAKIYLMENGKRRYIVSEQVFNQSGYNWSDVVDVTQAILNLIPPGPDIGLPPSQDTIPPQISISAPNGGENWIVGTQQNIKWNATDNVGVDHINIQFSSNNGVSWSDVVLGIANSGKYTWTVPNSVSNTCRIKVIAYDAAGNADFDISDGSFAIIQSCPVPSAPTLHNPTVSGDDYTISWSSVSGADSYVLQEDANASFSSPTEYPLNQISKFFNNKASGTYYYRVCAVNECGRGNWSNVKSYTQHLDTEPSKPVAIYPEDKATINSNSVTLQWESHGGNGQLKYTVYLAHWNPMGNPPIAEYITQTNYAVSDLDYNSSYYWQVYVYDEDGDDKLSDNFKFTVAPENNPPTGSVLINNGDATTVSFVVTLTLSATDTQSEVTSMRFSNDGAHWTSWIWYQTSYPWNLSNHEYGGNSKSGVKTVYVQFKDASNNISEAYTDTIEKISGAPGNIILNDRYYDTIRDAIAAAQPGDTVYLTAGVYTIQGETNPPRYPGTVVGIVLKDGVTLMGEGAENTTIIGSRMCAWTIIDANNSMVSGLTIMNESNYEPVLLESNASQLKNCIIKNSTRSAIKLYYSENNKICNNLIVNNDTGIRSHAKSNVKFYNNTITNNTNWGIVGYLKDGGHEIKNNIICYNNNTGVTIDQGFIFTHNDVYGNKWNYGDGGWMGDQTGINGNISSDPRFVNAAAGDYRPMAGSPCIDAGTNVGIPANGVPDMGAFEYNGTGTIRVESNHPDAAFTITGPQNFTGNGIDWSVSNVPIGIYSITFVPILNHNTPYYVSQLLESNQTLTFDGNYYPDEEPPQVSISINYDEYATANRFVDITLSASDEVAGLHGAEMQFSNNGSNWSLAEPYSTIKRDWDLGAYGGNLSSGTKTIYAKVSDGLGNWTESITDEILYVPNRRILSVPDEFQTIQTAIDAAQEGDVVWVAPGTYQEDIILKEGVILQGSGHEVTTLNYDTNDMITIAVANNSKIDGFTINKGRAAYISISCASASPIISNNIIYGSRRVDITGDCTPIIRNNIFDGNSSAILIFSESSAIIENNTIVNANGFGGIYIQNLLPNRKHTYITNNIIANNKYGIYDYNEDREHKIIFSSFNTYWNNTEGNFGGESHGNELFGPGDIDTEPMFTDPVNGDFSLQANSPCINSGNPEAKYNDADGTQNDRGAHGGPCANTNPNASFTIDSEIGSLGKEFAFDAFLSSDRETESNQLNFRWDWESDGVFDTSFSDNPQATHSYQTTGEKTITLQVRDEGGFVGSTSKTVTVINQPPNTPSNPNPAENATDQPINIQLSWQGGDPDSIDTVTYDVYFGTTSEPPLVSDDQTETTYNPGALEYHKFYYWKIVAKDNHEASATGPIWSFVTETESVPEAPSNLSALAISSNQIDLSWQDNFTNELGFKIERKKGADGTYIQIYTVDTGITVYSDLSLSPNTTYFYRVRAYNNTGDSEYSNEANATTPILGDVSQNRARGDGRSC